MPHRRVRRSALFVAGVLGFDGVAHLVRAYERTTLVSFSGEGRVTVATGLVGYRGGWAARMRPDAVLFHEHGYREVGFSEYGATVAALEAGLRGNRWHRAMTGCLDQPTPCTLEKAQVGAVPVRLRRLECFTGNIVGPGRE